MTNYKKMYMIAGRAIEDSLSILHASPQSEDALGWVQFLLEQAKIQMNYVYRVSKDNIYDAEVFNE